MSFLSGTDMIGGYGGSPILNGCTISVDRGEIAVVVGPNGAGKSTAMKAIAGMLNLTSGDVVLDGKSITTLPTQMRVKAGMAFVPQNDNIFPTMSVRENLDMGAILSRETAAQTMNEVFDLFPILAEKRNQIAGQLSGGQRQQLAMGRALMTRPTALMLDEPTAGVSPNVMDEMFEKIRGVAELGLAVLIVEQNAASALEVADIGYVLVEGRNRFTGSGQDLLNDPETRRSFLGAHS